MGLEIFLKKISGINNGKFKIGNSWIRATPLGRKVQVAIFSSIPETIGSYSITGCGDVNNQENPIYRIQMY